MLNDDDRVLLVEDSDVLRAALHRMLGRDAAVVAKASAIDPHIDTGGFRVAVLDIDLPGVSGIALARYLLEHELTERVVFFTGETDPEVLAAASALGAVVSKEKPGELAIAVGLPEGRRT